MNGGLIKCPACQQQSLGRHCLAKACPWHRCRNQTCELQVDLCARRGVIPLGKGRYRRVLLTS